MPHTSDAITLVIDPLEPLPPLRQSDWLLARVRQDIPAGATLVVRKTKAKTTRLGWPTTVLDIQIVEAGSAPLAPAGADTPLASTTRLIEQRITTCYWFLEYCVLAEVRARDLALLLEFKGQLSALLSEGRPDWSSSDTSLGRLLAGVAR
jgi:hypothetical protein